MDEARPRVGDLHPEDAGVRIRLDGQPDRVFGSQIGVMKTVGHKLAHEKLRIVEKRGRRNIRQALLNSLAGRPGCLDGRREPDVDLASSPRAAAPGCRRAGFRNDPPTFYPGRGKSLLGSNDPGQGF
jgi:hypothetical protein